jgi:hypothetical protein
MSQTYDFILVQGDSFAASIYAKNEDGSIINLSGYSASAYLKNGYADTGYLLNLNPVIESPVSGLIYIDLTPSQTASLPVTEAIYDLEIYQSGTRNVTNLVQGKVSILPQIL